MPCSYLIVDADRNFREALAIALRLDGHRVDVAASAEEAMARVAAHGADCCVVDAHLFGADAVASAAHGAGQRLVLTGPYPDLLAAAGRRHPDAALLEKPFRAADLARIGGGPAVAVVAAGHLRARG